VRKEICVPMMTLCLMLCSCGAKEAEPESVQSRYQEMAGCTMEAEICCDQKGTEWEAVLRCDYIPGENSTVEVLLPETIAGIRAVFDDTEWCLEYEDAVLDIGTLSEEKISPALCLPLLMDALREGWILEENTEDWNGVPCLRVTMDQSGDHGKIISTLWLRQDDGTPLRGEVSVEGEIILTAEFTSFTFYDTIT